MSEELTGKLSGKVIFLTGGGQGIGRECAKAYHRPGPSWPSPTSISMPPTTR